MVRLPRLAGERRQRIGYILEDTVHSVEAGVAVIEERFEIFRSSEQG